jgi:hypothetical protein
LLNKPLNGPGVGPNFGDAMIPVAELAPVAAIGYSIIYMLLGGGLGGAVLIFIVAKMLGK